MQKNLIESISVHSHLCKFILCSLKHVLMSPMKLYMLCNSKFSLVYFEERKLHIIIAVIHKQGYTTFTLHVDSLWVLGWEKREMFLSISQGKYWPYPQCISVDVRIEFFWRITRVWTKAVDVYCAWITGHVSPNQLIKSISWFDLYLTKHLTFCKVNLRQCSCIFRTLKYAKLYNLKLFLFRWKYILKTLSLMMFVQ